MSQKRKLLIIDDDSENREFLDSILSQHFEILLAADGNIGIGLAKTHQPDLILLDITMPNLDGFAACEILRSGESTRHIPVIMLTAADDSENRTQAFNRGADDFIARPFRTKELVARILSKVRRLQEREGEGDYLRCGNLQLNLPKLEVTVAARVVPLSLLEFNLLRHFVENKNRVLSRERILESVWRDSVVSDRTVDTHIAFLRKKLGAGFDHAISTVYGAGYVLKEHPQPSQDRSQVHG